MTGLVTRVMEQELPTILGYMSLTAGFYCSIFYFLCNVMQTVACPLVLFLLAIALSVILFDEMMMK
jgi:hypothetical protein